MKTAQITSLLLVVVLCAFGPRSSAEPVVIDLGVLPGYASSRAYAISGDKQFVVGDCGPYDDKRAFIWDAENGMQDLGAPKGANLVTAYDVSWHGEVVVGVCEYPDGKTAFRWTAENGMELLAPYTPTHYDVARGVSADGSVIVGYRWFSEAAGGFAFRWTRETGMVALPVLPGYETSFAYGVSGDGTAITGSSKIGSESTRAVVWYDDQEPFDIGGLDFGSLYDLHYGAAIGSDGYAVAGVSSLSGFLWRPGHGVLQLVEPYGFWLGPWATSVSDGGYAVTLSGLVILGDFFALYWNAVDGPLIFDRPPPWGLGLEGWWFYGATDISPDATSLVGYGSHRGVGDRAFLVTGLPSVREICPPDMNTDGAIDMFDVQLFLGLYSEGDAEADFVPDGTIDFFDLQSFLNQYASGCG
jgi:hypothetical protein